MMLGVRCCSTEAEFTWLSEAHAWRVEVKAEVLWWVLVAGRWPLLAKTVAYYLCVAHSATAPRIEILSRRHRVHVLLEFCKVFKGVLEKLLLSLLLLILSLEILRLITS
jgi:hypothetical protein